MTFCKSPKCPSSESLLSFQRREIADKTNQKIEKHLAGCEFCTAEVEFYDRFPQSEETDTAVEIPAALLELAEALFKNKKEGFRLLNKLVSENETLHLKEA